MELNNCSECEAKRRAKMNGEPNTPKVIQINNQEVTIFHRISVPASMGDDKVVIPENGLYRNVLLVYEANNHAYLYSSDGIPTLLTAGAGTMSFDELNNRPTYDGEVMTSQTNIPAITKVSQLENDEDYATSGEIDAAVGILNGKLADEETARKDMDNALQAAISSSAGTLAGDITSLQSQVNSEIQVRSSETSALNQALAEETANRTHDMDELSAALESETEARIAADAGLQTQVTETANKLNTVVATDTVLNTSESTISLVENKMNLSTGEESAEVNNFPVASADTAGIMNAATYQTIQDNKSNIEAILDASVAISGLSASVTQAQLTAAWKQATGRTELVNGAKINDSTNQKVWTYYSNTTTWYAATNTAQVTVSQATNTSLGIVKGSTANGQIAVETDGTLSLNGYDALATQSSSSASAITTLQSGKVDKVSGKQLSTNDYTTTEKNKLAGIAAGAEVNVQADWNITDTSSDAFIKNKPALKAVATSGSYADLTNKPSLATVATSGKYSDLTGAPVFATVATSGSYNDLVNKPSIPAAQVNSDWNATTGKAQILNKPTLATVATTGAYSDLSGKPTIPAAQVNSDWNATSGVAQIKNKPTLATVATSGAYSDLTGKPSLATVATSGSYADLSNKPTIPAAQVNSDWNATSGLAQIKNKPALATVATSGSYNDLSNKPTIPAAPVNADWNATSGLAQIKNKPTIPTVNNATLTIQKNGTNVATFTANSSSNATANITVPVITVTNTDPGEGSTLAANNFVFVY